MIEVTAQQWLSLVERAKRAYQLAYAPYSKFHVGSAALCIDGQIVQGCNVENASYGLTVCAERNCIANAVSQGQREFSALVVYTEQLQLTPPCGACRQVIAEFCTPNTQIMAANHLGQTQTWTVAQLLPDAFTPQSLHAAQCGQ
jgi:cytidine deaminase